MDKNFLTHQNVHLVKHPIHRDQIVGYSYPVRLLWVTQPVCVGPDVG